jgi:hypothetical protein
MGRLRRSSRRGDSAEGAEIPYKKGMYLPVIRGGYDYGYFLEYPHTVGSDNWERSMYDNKS